jgi:ribonuclease HI
MELTHKKEHAHYWKLYIDGASRNNPGLSGAGVYILKDSKPVFARGYFLGVKTNNQAEYLALLIGLHVVTALMGEQDLLLITSDSLLLVRQLKGEYAIRNEYIRTAHIVAKQLLEDIKYDVGHVLRDNNKHADALANKGIDEKMRVPEEFLNILRAHGISL